MTIAEDHDPAADYDPAITVVASAPKPRRRRLLGIVLTIVTAQYTIVAFIVGTSVAGVLHYLVTPQVVARFEAIAAALKN
jgi:hypothetical protein